MYRQPCVRAAGRVIIPLYDNMLARGQRQVMPAASFGVVSMERFNSPRSLSCSELVVAGDMPDPTT